MAHNPDGGEWIIKDFKKSDGWNHSALKIVTVYITKGKREKIEFSLRKTAEGKWHIDLGAFIGKDIGSTHIKTLPRAVKKKIREAYALVQII
jgi:hypothetical protein